MSFIDCVNNYVKEGRITRDTADEILEGRGTPAENLDAAIKRARDKRRRTSLKSLQKAEARVARGEADLRSTNIEDYKLVGVKSRLGRIGLRSAMSPEQQTAMSRSHVANKASAQIAEATLIRAGQETGAQITPNRGAIESRVNIGVAAAGIVAEKVELAFRKSRGIEAKGFQAALKRGAVEVSDYTGLSKQQTFDEFSDEVFWVIDTGQPSTNKQVNYVALEVQDFFKIMKDSAHEVGLISDELAASDTAKYLHRKWNTGKIISHRDKVQTRFASWLSRKQGDVQQALIDQVEEFSPSIHKMESEIKTINDRLRDPETVLSPQDIEAGQVRVQQLQRRIGAADGLRLDTKAMRKAEDDLVGLMRRDRPNAERIAQKKKLIEETNAALDEQFLFSTMGLPGLNRMADEIIDNILGTPLNRINNDLLPENMVDKASALKDRTFDIPNEMVRDLGIIETDVTAIMKGYARSVVPRIEIMRDYGSLGADDLFEELQKDWANIRVVEIKRMDAEGIEGKARQKEMNKLNREQNSDKNNLEAMLQRLLGSYKQPEDPSALGTRAIQFLKNINYITSLGGVVPSSIADISKSASVAGFLPAIRGLVRTISGSGSAAKEMNIMELKRANVGTEMILNDRMNSLAELTDNIVGATKLERGVQAAADKFGNVTGANYWNNFMKSWVGNIVHDQIVRTTTEVLASGKMDAKGLKVLRRAGLGDEMIKRIGAQAKQHGDLSHDMFIASVNKWDDVDAKTAFRAAVSQITNRAIVTPGIGDMPTFFGSGTSKLILQFKSFLFASQSRTLIAGIQQRDAAVAQSVVIAFGLGYLTYVFKETLAGREISDDPERIAFESFDRSGLAGWFTEPFQIVNKLSGGNLQASMGIEGSEMSRYASRNIIGAMLGPSFGRAQDLSSILRALITGEISESDVNATFRQIPGNNLFYLLWATNLGKDVAKEAVVNQ